MPIEKRWVIKPQGDPQKVDELATATGIPRVLANLLVQRGIDTYDEVSRFFSPKLSDLHDPFLMKDMEKAVRRVDEAVTRGQKIMVYGDYDVDGTTAVALVYIFLRQMGMEELLFYIPDRYTEGYGISKLGVDYAKKNGVDLIIALDCGIKAVEKVAYANQLGIDFIICDHHLPGEEIPAAVAVLDPKQPGDDYPFDELSGCGVGFKLVQGYCQYKGIPFESIVGLLDLVVVSTAADIVPLVGENRILAHYGLKKLNEKPRKGLQSIIKICGLEGHKITIDDIVFKIGPRINAAGRMAVDREEDMSAPSGGHAAVNLLVERNEDLADEFGIFIDSSNQARKSIDRSVTQEAHDYIRSHPEYAMMKSTVIYNPKWMKGIVGIVASRLIETYYRPTVVLTMSNGFVTGSARSVPGFDLYQAVESCADLLENFGGHMYAAGLTMKPGEHRSVHAPFQRIRGAEHRPEHAHTPGGDRFRTPLQRHHALVPRDAGSLPTFRTRQYGARIRDAGCKQPGRCETRGCGEGAPAHGPDTETETQHHNSRHRIPAARLPRMDTERPARGRLLYRGRESLSGENDAPATHQGHQDSPLRPGRQRPARIRNRRGPAEYVRRASPANIAIRMPSTPRVATPLFVSIRRQALPSSRSGLIPAVRKVKKRAVR